MIPPPTSPLATEKQQSQADPHRRKAREQVSGAAKPRQERGQRDEVKRRNAAVHRVTRARVASMSRIRGRGGRMTACDWSMRHGSMHYRAVRCREMRVSVKMRQMQPAEARASEHERKETEAEADRETDQIEVGPVKPVSSVIGFASLPHSRSCRGDGLPLPAASSGRSASSKRSASPGVSRIAPNSRKQRRVSFSRAALISTLLTSGSLANFSEPCSSQTSSLAFGRAQVGGQLGVVAVRVIHQKAGMHLEKLRQQRARRLRHVRARSVFDLRKIRLADGRTFRAAAAFAQLFADSAHQFELRHGTTQTAQRTFHFAQVPNFLAQLHRPRP